MFIVRYQTRWIKAEQKEIEESKNQDD